MTIDPLKIYFDNMNSLGFEFVSMAQLPQLGYFLPTIRYCFQRRHMVFWRNPKSSKSIAEVRV